MEDLNSRNKRLAKNTIVLYVRMLLTTIIGLFTSRIVLQQLGIIDYGVYNVVGGVVVMFSFLQSALGTGTTRFITYALGEEDSEKLQLTYTTCVILHFLLVAIVLFVAESIGLWFFYHYLVIPKDSLDAAFWVYQLSIITVCLSIICIPDNTLIISHERMNAFAYVSIFDSFAKLCVSYMLILFSSNRLVVYAVLICAIQVIVYIIYMVYCRTKFPLIKLSFNIDKKILTDVLAFSSYVVLPGFGSIACIQGLNILLNIFGGPVANAARGISVQVQALMTKITQSLQQATSPQITKLYAAHQYDQMQNLVVKTAKFSFYIMLVPFIPLFFGINIVLSFWLVEVPRYTVDFCQYSLVIALLSTIDFPFLIGASAEGHIRKLYTLGGFFCTLVVPIAYLVLKAGAPIVSVYVVHLIINIICVIIEIKLGGEKFFLGINRVIKQLLTPVLTSFVVCFFASYGIMQLLPYDGLLSLIVNSLIMVLITVIIIFIIGMTESERTFVLSKIKLSYYKTINK